MFARQPSCLSLASMGVVVLKPKRKGGGQTYGETKVGAVRAGVHKRRRCVQAKQVLWEIRVEGTGLAIKNIGLNL